MRPCLILLVSSVWLAVNHQNGCGGSRGGGVAAQLIFADGSVNRSDLDSTTSAVKAQTGISTEWFGEMSPGPEKSPESEQQPGFVPLNINDFVPNHDILSVWLICLTFFGIVGNTLVVLVWSKAKTFNSTTFILTSLALSDLGFNLSMAVLNMFFLFMGKPNYEFDWAFLMATYMTYVFQFSSVFCTLLVATTRYFAVKFPLKVNIWFRKSRIQLLVGCIAIGSLVCAAPASVVGCIFMYSFGSYDDYGPYDNSGDVGDVNQTSLYNTSLFITTPISTNATLTVTGISNVTLNPNVVSSLRQFFVPNSTTQEETASRVQSEYYSGYGDYGEYGDLGEMVEVCSLQSKTFQSVMVYISWALLHIFPWFVIAPINFLFLHQVRKAFTERKASLSKEEKENVALDLMIACVTSLSLLSYPAAFILELMTNNEDFLYYMKTEAPLGLTPEQSYYMVSLKETLAILNSSVNFLAYYICGQRFRKIFHNEVLQACKTTKVKLQDKSQPTSSETQSQTSRSKSSILKEDSSVTIKN